MDMNVGEQRVHAIAQNSFKDGCIFAFECVAKDIESYAPELKDPDFIRIIENKAQKYADNFIKAVRAYRE